LPISHPTPPKTASNSIETALARIEQRMDRLENGLLAVLLALRSEILAEFRKEDKILAQFDDDLQTLASDLASIAQDQQDTTAAFNAAVSALQAELGNGLTPSQQQALDTVVASANSAKSAADAGAAQAKQVLAAIQGTQTGTGTDGGTSTGDGSAQPNPSA
jgi:chromosome segregation ATPase